VLQAIRRALTDPEPGVAWQAEKTLRELTE
jgi:hypothetical protein